MEQKAVAVVPDKIFRPFLIKPVINKVEYLTGPSQGPVS